MKLRYLFLVIASSVLVIFPVLGSGFGMVFFVPWMILFWTIMARTYLRTSNEPITIGQACVIYATFILTLLFALSTPACGDDCGIPLVWAMLGWDGTGQFGGMLLSLSEQLPRSFLLIEVIAILALPFLFGRKISIQDRLRSLGIAVAVIAAVIFFWYAFVLDALYPFGRPVFYAVLAILLFLFRSKIKSLVERGFKFLSF